MDVVRFGLAFRALRRRRRLTQAEVAREAGVSRSVLWRIERARADRVAVHTLGAVAAVLGARLDVRLLWHGEGLDRLLDAAHADLVERVVGLFRANDWQVAVEVSFSIRGERGSVDVLAFHPANRTLLIVEVKSVVPDLQGVLGGLDRKARLGRDIAAPHGWRPSVVGRLLVLPDERTTRRRTQQHQATLAASLPVRSAGVRAWLRRPAGELRGILFLPSAHQAGKRRRGPAAEP